MAFQKTSVLTSKNSNTYSSSAEWIAEHGACGTETPGVTNWTITADGTNAVTRVLQFATEADGQAVGVTVGTRDESTRTWTTAHEHTGLVEV